MSERIISMAIKVVIDSKGEVFSAWCAEKCPYLHLHNDGDFRCYAFHEPRRPRGPSVAPVVLTTDSKGIRRCTSCMNGEKAAHPRFLECMMNNLNDISEGTDEEVRAELVEMGIDPDEADRSFLALLARLRKDRP